MTEQRTYIIALGSNLGDSEAIFTRALTLLEKGRLQGSRVSKCSNWIRTPALVHPEYPDVAQGDYLNAILALHSSLEPAEMMQCLLQVEKELGRDRESESIPWAPRCIDLDIVACGNFVASSPELIVPHPEMHRRDFVLTLMQEVAPEWVHPIFNRGLSEMLDDLRAREAAHASGVACF